MQGFQTEVILQEALVSLSKSSTEPELVVVEGLTFRPGQAVRIEFQLSETAGEEGQFAKPDFGLPLKSCSGQACHQ